MALTAEEQRQFEAQGFLVVEALLSPAQIDGIRGELRDLHERMADNTPPEVGVSWEHDVDPSIQRRIKQLMHAEKISPTIDAFLRSDRVLDIVTDLIGPDICL